MLGSHVPYLTLACKKSILNFILDFFLKGVEGMVVNIVYFEIYRILSLHINKIKHLANFDSVFVLCVYVN